jgi:hypothetical protein
MTNVRAIALATILGISAPTLIDTAIGVSAVAAFPVFPTGDFSDGNWMITLYYDNNVRHYHGWNLKTGDTISLSGGTVSGDSRRWVYSWLNDDYIYEVSWRPSDPNIIRLQVFDPNGKTIVNRLMTKQTGVGG